MPRSSNRDTKYVKHYFEWVFSCIVVVSKRETFINYYYKN